MWESRGLLFLKLFVKAGHFFPAFSLAFSFWRREKGGGGCNLILSSPANSPDLTQHSTREKILHTHTHNLFLQLFLLLQPEHRGLHVGMLLSFVVCQSAQMLSEKEQHADKTGVMPPKLELFFFSSFFSFFFFLSLSLLFSLTGVQFNRGIREKKSLFPSPPHQIQFWSCWLVPKREEKTEREREWEFSRSFYGNEKEEYFLEGRREREEDARSFWRPHSQPMWPPSQPTRVEAQQGYTHGMRMLHMFGTKSYGQSALINNYY